MLLYIYDALNHGLWHWHVFLLSIWVVNLGCCPDSVVVIPQRYLPEQRIEIFLDEECHDEVYQCKGLSHFQKQFSKTLKIARETRMKTPYKTNFSCPYAIRNQIMPQGVQLFYLSTIEGRCRVEIHRGSNSCSKNRSRTILLVRPKSSPKTTRGLSSPRSGQMVNSTTLSLCKTERTREIMVGNQMGSKEEELQSLIVSLSRAMSQNS